VSGSGAPDVVVGGGLAGLSAAVVLARAGRRVLVLEARGGLGGRATAHRDRATGERVDNGQHVLLGCYRATRAYLDTIGARDHVRFQPALEVPYVDRGGRRTVLRCPALPSPLHLVAGVLTWNGLPLRERVAVLRLAPALLRARRLAQGQRVEAARPGETVEGWLVRHRQGPRLRELLWEPLALAALNQPADAAAAPPFVRVLGGLFGPDRHDAAIGLPVKPLDEALAEPARRFVEARGGEVRTRALARVRLQQGRVAAVEVRGERLDAARVVAAVPWHALPALFVGDVAPLAGVLAAAEATAASPIVTVNLWFDRAVLDTPFVGLPGRVMQWVFDKRWAFGLAASHLSLVSSGAADVLRETSERLVEVALAEVHASLPRARDATLLRATVVREPRATFSLAPGQPPRPAPGTPIEGLALAGDWVDTGLPATIEGAVLSGQLAASVLLGTGGDDAGPPGPR